ncbi:hypothetical protein B296_00041610 [Ensete ventricosum]|uniref:Uncharacterized protein n=1 Tax=Ensete ventricosum TaxID=4639 RepID=A0A426XA97_ENSVE|nr:hypothetical protein B296_00041610 [Ensete ventricosum]
MVSEPSKERGRPTIARPSTRAADHGHTPCRGGRPRPAPLQGRAAAAKAVGAAARNAARGAPVRASRSNQPARGCRLRPALLPVGARRRPQGWPSLSRAVDDHKGSPPPA